MERFTITHNEFLEQDVEAYYHTDFGGVGFPGNPNFLYRLKNDPHHNWSEIQLQNAQNQLRGILIQDLRQLQSTININSFTVCVIPRAKADNTYQPNQLLFKTTISNTINELGDNFIDGTSYITRHTNTRTTHLRRPIQGYNNDGDAPYPGISNNTCDILEQINGQDILLIDDIYTRTINIDEDMIQALFDQGANSVTFYAIGRTIYNN